jgi:serine/threonine protein kinase
MRALTQATGFDGGGIGNVVDAAYSSFDRHAWHADALCGRGGTAEVWHAVAPDGREAALKRLKSELRRRARLQQQLRREYGLLRAVASPHLVQPLGLIERDDGPEIALEYLPNGDLVSLLGAPTRYWLPAIRSVVAAVAKLHEHGVAHGDLKARNVLFAADGGARLIDLMSARPVDAPAVRATAAYSLPVGTKTTARAADCFALAVLLHELVTARLPYGVDGPTRDCELRVAARPAEPAAARLLAAALAMLEAGGRVPLGLSCLADVIESVGATGA